ncbi:MAG: peptidoglycan-binding protein, partial [Clostridiales bacterium]|nr:peptidoglycan-binding protein [Clostridiales bacterium]
MSKKFALISALTLIAVVTAGCSDQDGVISAASSPDTGVDIVVPYATTTISPDPTTPPDDFLINGEGKVILNNPDLLNGTVDDAVDAMSNEATGYTQLRLGDTSTAVSNLQTRLTELGYYSAGVSGVFDDATEEAVKLFEKGYGVMQTGIATAALQKRLFSEEALVYGSEAYTAAVDSHYTRLEKGDTGSAVIALQNRLAELGYPVEQTGVYDDDTVAAVRLFYEAYDYKPRDYAIVDLQKALYSDQARAYAAAPEETAAAREDGDLTLMAGDSGARVTQLQLRLRDLGYLTEATGEYDQATVQAVSAFQVACRVEQTGVAGVDLQKQLFAEDAPASGEMKQIYALLQWGDTGDGVKNLQNRLAELGYYEGAADGVFSDDMVQAVKAFQAAAGEEETGVATVALQETAFSDGAPLSPSRVAEAQADAAAAEVTLPSLMKGDNGDEVKNLQSRLTELGFYSGEADGNYGGGTQDAVEAFQKALGVEQTGEV